jgi:hypothetical protein
MSSQTPVQNQSPLIIMAPIEPGTRGDISFVDKMIDTYKQQDSNQSFIILLHDLGDDKLADNNLVQQLKSKVGEDNVRIIHSESDSSHEIAKSWKLQEEIASSKPMGIVYGPMIMNDDCATAKRIAAVNNIPFVAVPEYSYKYDGPNTIKTGPGPDAKGMFLGAFEENQPANSDDIDQKIGKSMEELKSNHDVFFAYLNNHQSGRGANPETFEKELLSYLYFVTSSLVHNQERKPAEVFTRISPEIFEKYLHELQENNPYDNGFQIQYDGKEYLIPGKSGVHENIVKINLNNPFPLQKETMVAMMQACKSQQNPVCATGDQSLSETVSIGVPFFYQTMPWKRDLAQDLNATAVANGFNGISAMNSKGFTFNNLSDADGFAKEYNEHKNEWASQYASLNNHIADLHENLPKEIESALANQSRLGYAHRNRFHMAAVNPQEFKELKKQFTQFKGDALKANILADFKNKIESAPNEATLNIIVSGLKDTDEYKVLEKGQGLATKALGLETSSINEFNTIVEEARNALSSSNSQKLSA